MPDVGDDRVCRRCGRRVQSSREDYELFERMHWVCFHFEFEHEMFDRDADPDQGCHDPSCPSAHAGRHTTTLAAVLRELVADWADGPPAGWDHESLPSYLEALAAWLEDCEGYYANLGHGLPRNAAELLADGLRAATVYE